MRKVAFEDRVQMADLYLRIVCRSVGLCGQHDRSGTTGQLKNFRPVRFYTFPVPTCLTLLGFLEILSKVREKTCFDFLK